MTASAIDIRAKQTPAWNFFRGYSVLGSGFTSGLLASVFTQPLEVVKTILIVNPTSNPNFKNSNSFRSIFESIKFTYQYQNKGISNFFQGSLLSGLR